MSRFLDFSSRCILGCGLALAFLVPVDGARASSTEIVLYSFCNDDQCTDGSYPQSGVVQDSAGNLYGTAINGGGYNCGGVVFELSPIQQTPWNEQVLPICNPYQDFFEPNDVIIDSRCPPNNNSDCPLYGTTYGFTGFNPTVGGVFSVTGRVTGTTNWTWNPLIGFPGNYNSPKNPNGVIMVNGVLYGTTAFGGPYNTCGNGCGTLFATTPAGASGNNSIFYFCHAQNGTFCTQGDWPNAISADANGNLYGTTRRGGIAGCGQQGGGCGTVFEYSPQQNGPAIFTSLYAFHGGEDGANPMGAPIVDGHGNIYGTTGTGGAYGSGAVFELTPPAYPGEPWRNTIIYSFGGTIDDGGGPVGSLILVNGGLYGTTEGGGSPNCNGGCGTVFELAPNTGQCSSHTGWCETVLYSFCSDGGACSDGQWPLAGVIADNAGNLYGTTYDGGANGAGTVFEVETTQ